MSPTEEKLNDKVAFLNEQNKRLFLEKENLVRASTQVNKKLMAKTNELEIVKTAAANRIGQADKQIKVLNDKLSRMYNYSQNAVDGGLFRDDYKDHFMKRLTEIRGPVISTK